MAGVDLATVKELLGHKDISMTMRYAHLSSDHKHAAVKKLEKVPAIFTTPPQSPYEDLPQVLEK
jgi:integrase